MSGGLGLGLSELSLSSGKPGTATAPATPFSFAWVSQASQTIDSANFNTAAISIGAADANRFILMGMGGRLANTVTSVTLNAGAITATQVSGAVATEVGQLVVDWWYAPVPTGTTATFEITFNTSTSRAKLEVYRVVSATATPSASPTGAHSPSAASLNQAVTIPAGGAGASMFFHILPGNANNITWTNATLDDTSIQLEGFSTVGSATVAATNTVTAAITAAASSVCCMATATWAP